MAAQPAEVDVADVAAADPADELEVVEADMAVPIAAELPDCLPVELLGFVGLVAADEAAGVVVEVGVGGRGR